MKIKVKKCGWCGERPVIDNNPDYNTCEPCLKASYVKDKIPVLKIYDKV